jgi:Lipase (class 3)
LVADISSFADLTDLKLLKTTLDPSIFPYIPIDIEVHKGFAEEHAKCDLVLSPYACPLLVLIAIALCRTAALVLQAVQSLLRMHPGAMVTVIGHSLGAALALLDGLRLRLVLAPTTVVRVIGYGMPRVGNQAFASFVDGILPNLVKHINNKHDPIPIVPAMSIGFRHVSGEIHIQETGQWIGCPHEDNPDPLCIVGAVPSIFQATFSDHSGPYNHIMLKCDI